jgi:hypothetical protein
LKTNINFTAYWFQIYPKDMCWPVYFVAPKRISKKLKERDQYAPAYDIRIHPYPYHHPRPNEQGTPPEPAKRLHAEISKRRSQRRGGVPSSSDPPSLVTRTSESHVISKFGNGMKLNRQHWQPWDLHSAENTGSVVGGTAETRSKSSASQPNGQNATLVEDDDEEII